MTETHGFFGAADDVRYYNQSAFSKFIRSMRLNGYVKDSLNELEVTQNSSPGMSVFVKSGEAWVQGNYYGNSATLTLAITAANPTYGRIDRVILRNDITGQRRISACVLEGTPSNMPSPPELTHTDDLWEIPLASVMVGAGVTSITGANITDERDMEECGVAAPRAVRISDLLTGDPLDMDNHKIENVATPVDDHDGAPLSFIEGVSLTIPVGTVHCFAGSTIPDDWMECDGTTISRITYAALFAVIGTSYGVGDGSTTFNLPLGRGRSIFGYDSTQTEFDTVGETGGEKTHVLITAELPAHTHAGIDYEGEQYDATTKWQGGAFYAYHVGTKTLAAVGGGLTHANLPPYIVLKTMIKVV